MKGICTFKCILISSEVLNNLLAKIERGRDCEGSQMRLKANEQNEERHI